MILSDGKLQGSTLIEITGKLDVRNGRLQKDIRGIIPRTNVSKMNMKMIVGRLVMKVDLHTAGRQTVLFLDGLERLIQDILKHWEMGLVQIAK